MQGTDAFKETIKAYLDNMAKTDKEFSVKYANKKKSIDECTTYILGEVKKSGKNGFTDNEVYGMAVHYYDEVNLKVTPSKQQGKVVVNHVAEPKKVEPTKIEASKPSTTKVETDILCVLEIN